MHTKVWCAIFLAGQYMEDFNAEECSDASFFSGNKHLLFRKYQ